MINICNYSIHFTPHVIAWSVRKGFNQSIRRTKEQNTRLRCLASAMPKPVMPPGAMKSAKLLQDEKVQGSGSMKTPWLNRFFLAVLYCSVPWKVMCLSIETSFSLIFVPFNFLRLAQSYFVFYQLKAAVCGLHLIKVRVTIERYAEKKLL